MNRVSLLSRLSAPVSALPLSALTGAALLLLLLSPGLVGLFACGPSDPVAELRQQQAGGEYRATLEPLRELLSERPDDAELNFLYGRALAATQQPSLAEWSLRKAMEDPEYLVAAGLQLAYGAARSGNHDTTIEVTSRILEASPEQLDALLLRADSYARSTSEEENEKALADVERILELDPDSLDALEARVVALLGLQRYEEVGPVIDEIGERIEQAGLGRDKQAWYCATRAIYADDSGEVERARERWEDCVERFPAHGEVVPKAVAFYDERGEVERSIEVLRAALEEIPQARSYRTNLATRLRRAGRADEATEVLRAATEAEQPLRASAGWIDLAQHLHDTGDTAGAAEAAERAVELARATSTPHPQLVLEYADLLVLAGELERALAVADEMSVPAHAESVRARVAQERGRPAEALERFEEVFRLWPDNATTRYYAARAAEAVGDFERAIEAYRYAIRIDPDATDARLRLARLHAAEGKPTEALNLLRLLADREPLGLEGELLSVRLWTLLGEGDRVRQSLARTRQSFPALLGRMVASAAEGLREREGPEAALRLLRGVEGLDLESPAHAGALRALVRYAHEAGTPEEAQPVLEAALRAHPESGVLHEIRGLALERAGSVGPARRAYERALELEPEAPRALAGLGRLAREEGELERALAFFERAAEADPGAVDAKRAAAEVLAASGREEEAEERLMSLLREHPLDGSAAARLAALRLERDGAAEQTLALARRGVRFGGGAEAQEILGRVRERLEAAADPEQDASREAVPSGA